MILIFFDLNLNFEFHKNIFDFDILKQFNDSYRYIKSIIYLLSPAFFFFFFLFLKLVSNRNQYHHTMGHMIQSSKSSNQNS